MITNTALLLLQCQVKINFNAKRWGKYLYQHDVHVYRWFQLINSYFLLVLWWNSLHITSFGTIGIICSSLRTHKNCTILLAFWEWQIGNVLYKLSDIPSWSQWYYLLSVKTVSCKHYRSIRQIARHQLYKTRMMHEVLSDYIRDFTFSLILCDIYKICRGISCWLGSEWCDAHGITPKFIH